ncbi:MAG TPA: hypothetical protein VFX23_07940 [Limnobacter sp.]|uniref:hypothetical protein n=1 Tax=Limnobacter sp. TaxID=2003368 RepID=UPI002E3238A2|nr:hypothetical protein [Limnobacter sp.]HEX5485913.1 hypothetical protein [Limnobacter sp.]
MEYVLLSHVFKIQVTHLRKLILFFAGLVVVASSRAGPVAHRFTKGFLVSGNRFTLVLEKVSGSENPTNGSALYQYSVIRNGKSQTFEGIGGAISTCYSKAPLIESISTTKHPVAWLVLTGGLCGNTFSYQALVIAPELDVASGKGTFTQFSFETKYKPYLISYDDSIDIWYARQFWGRGGTSTSIFLPKLINLTFDDFGMHRKAGVVSAHLTELPNIEKSIGIEPYFPSLFVAGFQNTDPELMQYAMSCCYKHEESEKYQPFFRKTDQEYLNRLIDKVKDFRQLTSDYSWPQD